MYWGFMGMHFMWWIFWFAALAIFFSFLVPVPRSRYIALRETPLDILRRRYAAGELTSAEFDERCERLGISHPRSPSADRVPPRVARPPEAPVVPGPPAH